MKVLGQGWPEEDFNKRIRPVIDEMMMDRSWIMNSYAQMEYLAADLIVKCRKFDEYKEACRKLPFGIDKRFSLLKRLCEAGPLAPHSGDLLPLFEHLLQLENARHFFAHGFLSVHITRDGREVGMHLRRYVQPEKGKDETRAELFIRPKEMATAREHWLLFVQSALMIIRDIYEALNLDAHDVTEGQPQQL